MICPHETEACRKNMHCSTCSYWPELNGTTGEIADINAEIERKKAERGNKQVEKLIDGFGAIAEMSLVFFRGALGAGATTEEAMRLTQVFIAAQIWGRPKTEEDDG